MKRHRHFWFVSLIFSMIMLLTVGNYQGNSMAVPVGQSVVLAQDMPTHGGSAIFDVPSFGQYQLERGVSVPLKFSNQETRLQSQSAGRTYFNDESFASATIMLTLKSINKQARKRLLFLRVEVTYTCNCNTACMCNANYRAREKI